MRSGTVGSWGLYISPGATSISGSAFFHGAGIHRRQVSRGQYWRIGDFSYAADVLGLETDDIKRESQRPAHVLDAVDGIGLDVEG